MKKEVLLSSLIFLLIINMGIIIADTGCIDTDGINFYEKGTCTDSTGTYEDECIEIYNETRVREYHCNEDGFCEEYLPGAVGRACVGGVYVDIDEDKYQCTDTDDTNFYKKGTCTDSTGTYEDECINDTSLYEYWCDGNFCKSFPVYEGNWVNCTNGAFEEISDIVYGEGIYDNIESICGDGICDNIEKKISCGEYLFDDGKKYDICRAYSTNCPIDCGKTLGEYFPGEEMDAPICGDGVCEEVEVMKTCGEGCSLPPACGDDCIAESSPEEIEAMKICKTECNPDPYCLEDCGIIAKTAPQDYNLPIEIENIIDPNPGISVSGGEDPITQVSPYRDVHFYRFENIQTQKECEEKKSEYCFLNVTNEGVKWGLRKRESFFSWFRKLFGLSNYKEYEIPYYEALKIKEGGSEALGWYDYTEYIPIFDSIVVMWYHEGNLSRGILTNESCINDLMDKYTSGKMPGNCSIEELSEKSFLSGYLKDELAWLSYYCIQAKIGQMEREGKIVIDEEGTDLCHEFHSTRYYGSASEIFNCLSKEDCSVVFELDVEAVGPEEMFTQEELEEAKNCYEKCGIDWDCASDEYNKCLRKSGNLGDCSISALTECEV